MKQGIVAAAVGLLVAGAALAQPVSEAVRAALADPLRPAADQSTDQRRKARETLAFAGVAPGQSVVEFFPGGGYYTRILSRIVGPRGRVYVLPWGEPNTGGSVRLAADPRYGNITAFLDNPVAFRPAAPIDVVWTSQNYHDIESPQRPQINRAVFKMLKPGGTYFILDHSAVVGSGYATIRLHRIDEALVKNEVAAAGFILAGESDVLRNAKDDRSKNVFDRAIRGETDQFLLKFVKPMTVTPAG